MTAKRQLQVTISLLTTEGAADKTAPLLQRGFLLPINGTASIAAPLAALPGFSEEYIRERVQTIFVNGLAEDNIARELIADDTLARPCRCYLPAQRSAGVPAHETGGWHTPQHAPIRPFHAQTI